MPHDARPTPPATTRRLLGRPAGQREDLVARLRNLATEYPAGTGILKEFLQNADDAGATWVRFVLDLRDLPAETLPDGRMAPLLGAALRVESDQAFTLEDLENIQRIGAEGKVGDASKTGRFGLGFNTVYSITDYPSFATRDLIMTFDPFFDVVGDPGPDPGYVWDLAALWGSAASWPRAFDLEEGVTELGRRTVFRLPLRTEAQAGPKRIGPTSVPASTMEEILGGLGEWGGGLLLFLRSVVDVTVHVIRADGTAEERIGVTTLNPDEVRAARARVLPPEGETPTETLARCEATPHDLPVATYLHDFEVRKAGTRHVQTWLVSQGMFVGDDDTVLTAARAMGKAEKPVPLAGAALRVEPVGEALRPVPTPGALYCTLPIPRALPLGLALNARWSLTSSRADVRFGAADATDEGVKVRWNRALAAECVPAAVATLLAALAPRLDEAAVPAYYAAWPDEALTSAPLDKLLANSIYSALTTRDVVRAEQGGAVVWGPPADATLPPAGWSEDLIAAVVADGLALARPTPPHHVTTGLAAVEEGLTRLAPAEVRAWVRADKDVLCALADAPRACLRTRERVEALLAFCSERGTAPLAGLPLALMEDGTLRTFGIGSGICLGDDAARSILRSRPDWFIDCGIERAGLVRRTQATNLLAMEPKEVIKWLKVILAQGADSPWHPSGDALPNDLWLAELYTWLAELPNVAAHREAFLTYALVPSHPPGGEPRLVRPGTARTPLLPTDEAPLTRVLLAFGVPLVTGRRALVEALRPLAAKTGDLVRDVTPGDVLEALAVGPIPEVLPNSPHRRALLDWFAEAHAEGRISAERMKKLAPLPLWPTKDGRVVAAAAVRVFLPRGTYQPPPEFAQLTLLYLGPDERWRALLEALGVPTLGVAEWIERVFLPDYGTLEPAARVRALRWLREEGMRALTGDEASIRKIRDGLANTALVEAAGGGLHKATDLYHPDAREALALLGPVARVPDMAGAYGEDPEAWATLFTRLRLHVTALDKDVGARVDQLLRDATEANADTTDAALLALHEHVATRWSKGTDHEKTDLARKLREQAWMPTLRRPSREDGVALFAAPSARRVRPAQVYPARLVHEAGSQVAFFAGREDAHVRTVLGMPSEVTPEQALAHFRAVRDRWLSQDQGGLKADAVARTASAFYRLVAQLVRMAAGRNPVATTKLAVIQMQLAGTACVWDGARFWKGAHTFAGGVADLAGLRAQVAADAQDALALDFLGRRAAPEAADRVAVLRELQATYPDEPLPAPLLKAAWRCWKELADGGAALLMPDLPIPTDRGRLVRADAALVDDARYWRQRLGDAALPWVHPQVPEKAALQAGVRRLTAVVREQRVSWRPEASEGVETLCAERSRHLASGVFLRGLQRLVAHALDVDADPPDEETLARAVRLPLVACGDLAAGLVCPAFGVELPVGIAAVACLLDEDESPPHVWVASDEVEVVAAELARALLRRLGDEEVEGVEAVDRAALEDILRCRTDRIETRLNQRMIRSLLREPDAEETPTDSPDAEGEGPTDGVDENDARGVDGSDYDEPDAGEEGDHDGPDAEDEGEDSADPSVRRRNPPSGGNGLPPVRPSPSGAVSTPPANASPRAGGPWSGSPGPHPSSSGGAHPRPIDAAPRERQVLEGRVASGGSEGGVGPRPEGPRAAPTIPHQGQSAGRAGGSRGQFYSYVASPQEGAEDQSDPSAPGRLATERAALDHVDAVEAARGATIVAMAQENEGYDREITVPGEPEARIVEVKGLGEGWDGRGVRLTPAELRAAHSFGLRYWLYVVEFAKDSARRRLFRIQNPAGQATAYCFDHGWKALEEPEIARCTPAPGLVLFDGDERIGVIVSVTPRGEASRLVLDTGAGSRCERTWNPTRHRLGEAG